ncbi:alpha/beta fold hydrolase [Legionella tunisiensis]|uniref:alpha/beta fold hydrolase n=1 Tax=Legionella tunisiensis TaxID=1034944 RepID=UPI0002DC6D44|nr:alpha/beta fold hydrolase [Legionella tunisiensis]
MHALYPPIKPYKCSELAVSEPHVLYVEETGNPTGLPVLVLHSGPGAEGANHLRRFFDPQIYRIVLFDQRGCGRSTPHAELKNNSTQNLLDDIDTIRDYLNITRFVLFGGGWGFVVGLTLCAIISAASTCLIITSCFFRSATGYRLVLSSRCEPNLS